MGNKTSKDNRGQALGSSDPQGGRQQPPRNAYEQQRRAQEARDKRAKLVTEKHVHGSEIQRKERILGIVEGTDRGGRDPSLARGPPKAAVAAKSRPAQGGAAASGSSLYMVDPSSAEARAAEQRMQAKAKSSKSGEAERRAKTRDLLFGDGLKEKEFVPQAQPSPGQQGGGGGLRPKQREEQLFVAGTDAGDAAMARMQAKKSGHGKDRRERTMQLLHGDELKDKRAVEPKLRDAHEDKYRADLTPGQLKAEQGLRNLQNCNASVAVPGTAKMLRKIVGNLLKAESAEEQEKFGRLRLSNKRIKSLFVDLVGGVECLEAIGFERTVSPDGAEQVLVFNFSTIDQEALWHVIHLLDTHYPET